MLEGSKLLNIQKVDFLPLMIYFIIFFYPLMVFYQQDDRHFSFHFNIFSTRVRLQEYH